MGNIFTRYFTDFATELTAGFTAGAKEATLTAGLTANSKVVDMGVLADVAVAVPAASDTMFVWVKSIFSGFAAFATVTIPAYFSTPTADDVTNSSISYSIGNKTDTIAGTSIISLEKQNLANTTFNTQIFEKSITVAANAGATVIATATTQDCMVDVCLINADAAAPAHLTTCGITAGTALILELIPITDATNANLDTAGKQVTWDNSRTPILLKTGETISMDLQGTGTDAVDLTVITYYKPVVDGGTLA